MADGMVDVGGSDGATDQDLAELQKALGATEGGQEGQEGQGAQGGQDDGGQSGQTDDFDEDDERSTKVDAELDAAGTDAEREQIRARRRAERQRKKQQRNEKLDSLERLVQTQAAQLQQQAEVLARIQNTNMSSQLAQLDGAIDEAANAYEQFKGILADATTKADGTTAAQATERMNQARERHQQLTAAKERIVASTRTAQPVDPRVANEARRFAAAHPWYKGPQSQDPDSQIITLLDNAVSRERFDPTTPEYWAELESRARRYLPHRFNKPAQEDASAGGSETGYTGGSGEPRPKTPRSPVGGAGNGSARNQQGGFRLSAERVAAMKEAGIWDDPARRAKMIERYKQQDRQQGA